MSKNYKCNKCESVTPLDIPLTIANAFDCECGGMMHELEAI